MIAAWKQDFTREAADDGRERLDAFTGALEETVVTIVEDTTRSHRYMDQLARMLGRVHELRQEVRDGQHPRETDRHAPVMLRLGMEELASHSLGLQRNAHAHHDDDLAVAFEGLRQRLSVA
ncbi:hypothetical protein [Mucisphaera calidilacus]|nr:hypothetical protein [Mucisphaera calidilacus]